MGTRLFLLLSVLLVIALGTIIFLYKTYDRQLNLPLLSSTVSIIYSFAAMWILKRKARRTG